MNSFTRHRRAILIGFGALDALLLVRFMPQIAWPSYVFDGRFSAWTVALEVCRLLFLVSLAFSALGLVLARRWAIVLSYVQFPFRFVIMLLSFGFIGLLARIPHFPVSYLALMITAMILECIRLAVTIAVHRGPNQPLQLPDFAA
jgi:hypothetical protein